MERGESKKNLESPWLIESAEETAKKWAFPKSYLLHGYGEDQGLHSGHSERSTGARNSSEVRAKVCSQVWHRRISK